MRALVTVGARAALEQLLGHYGVRLAGLAGVAVRHHLPPTRVEVARAGSEGQGLTSPFRLERLC
ncbi:hypothetical protein [Kitasatospora sp. NPDC056531]|uniref:hypothetical protein n=1 Tax=Kitasatospora sp. NPDC056531 TaxID=3345856 RepID=UPI0036C4DDA6